MLILKLIYEFSKIQWRCILILCYFLLLSRTRRRYFVIYAPLIPYYLCYSFLDLCLNIFITLCSCPMLKIPKFPDVHYTQIPCCPCMDNMARSFPFTIGSPLKMRRKWTAKTHQHAHADTHQPAFFYIWPNDIDECSLVRFHHVDAFSVMLHGFFKCWIFGHSAFHRKLPLYRVFLSTKMYLNQTDFIMTNRENQTWDTDLSSFSSFY